jgi:DNA polymerase
MTAQRQTIYEGLGTARKQCARCEGLVNPSRCADGQYDSEEIGPWTRWQGRLDAELMVVGQDWGDVGYFESHCGLDEAKNPTNRRLRELLAQAGFEVADVGVAADHGTVFLTNAILCLKSGGLGGPVKSAWFAECGPRFLRPQIELVRPRAVVALGERAYRAICRAFDMRARQFRAAVESECKAELLLGVRLFPVYHCSPRVLAATRTWDKQESDWHRIGVALGRIQGEGCGEPLAAPDRPRD